MSRRAVVTCDRCGVEADDGVSFAGERISGRAYALMSDARIDVDLCTACHRKFREWMRAPRAER
jgi:hypothetical protein